MTTTATATADGTGTGTRFDTAGACRLRGRFRRADGHVRTVPFTPR